VAYLKHVVVSFLLASDEASAPPTTRERLLPVLGQLLDLSPAERQAAMEAVGRQAVLLRAGYGRSRGAGAALGGLFGGGGGGGLSSLWGGGGGGAPVASPSGDAGGVP
jgi:hypothetical protein